MAAHVVNPAIHPSKTSSMMEARVKPAHDEFQ